MHNVIVGNNYAVLRVEKIKTFSALAAMQNHWNRATPTPNVDPKKTKLNKYYHGNANIVKSVRAKLDEKGIIKLRQNGVLALEFILTFSHEFLYDEETEKLLPSAKENYRKWLIASVNWAKTTYGERLISLENHLDEKTPHIHFLVLPLDTSKNGKNGLNARGITGGAKKLRGIQDSYAKAVEHCGLRRGVRGSTAKHTTIKEFSKALSQGKKLARDVGVPLPSDSPKKFNDWNKNIVALEAALTKKNQLESDEIRSVIDELIATNTRLTNELQHLKSQQKKDGLRLRMSR
jgi:hypothetical protein